MAVNCERVQSPPIPSMEFVELQLPSLPLLLIIIIFMFIECSSGPYYIKNDKWSSNLWNHSVGLWQDMLHLELGP